MTPAEEIVAGLDDAQKAFLVGMPDSTEWFATHDLMLSVAATYGVGSISGLVEQGLAEVQSVPIAKGKDAPQEEQYRLTRTGLDARRAIG